MLYPELPKRGWRKALKRKVVLKNHPIEHPRQEKLGAPGGVVLTSLVLTIKSTLSANQGDRVKKRVAMAGVG
jgi:hypothetical protein